MTSLLELKCITGFHEIKAIRLRFEKTLPAESCIKSVSIKVQVSPNGFRFKQSVQIVDSESVLIEFRKVIRTREGNIVDIEVEAKNSELCKFFQFDETCPMSANPHFNISVSSLPKQGKLFFISEIEYGTQDDPKFSSKIWKRRIPKK